MDDVDVLHAHIAALHKVVKDFLECPYITDKATVPLAGIEASPEQVVVNMSVSYSKIIKAIEVLKEEQ
jgi:hypothetical protein